MHVQTVLSGQQRPEVEQVALAVWETKCTLTILKVAALSDNSKVRSSVSTHMHLQSAARHELLDNVQAGGHALGGVGLHAPHPLELHNMPASKHTSCVFTS